MDSQPIIVTPGLAYLRTVSDQTLWSWASSWDLHNLAMLYSSVFSSTRSFPAQYDLASSRCHRTSRLCSSTTFSSLPGLLPTPNSDEVCLHFSLSVPLL